MLKRDWQEETRELVEKLEEEKIAKKLQDRLAKGILNNTLLISVFGDIRRIIKKSDSDEAKKINKVLDAYEVEYDKIYGIGKKE